MAAVSNDCKPGYRSIRAPWFNAAISTHRPGDGRYRASSISWGFRVIKCAENVVSTIASDLPCRAPDESLFLRPAPLL